MFSKELGDPGATEFDHPSRTYRGDGRYRDQPVPLKAHPLSGCAKEPFQGGKPPGDGVLALAFHTLLSFQGTSPGCSSATHLRFPRRVTAGAAGRYHGPFRSSKTSHLPGQRTPGGVPPATSSPSHRSAALRPDLLGVRTATEQPSDRILLAFGDLLSSDADATGVVPERSSVSKNFPACSLEKVAPDSTACQLDAIRWTPAITTVPAVSSLATAGGGPVFPDPVRTLTAPGGGPGTGGRRSAGGRPAPPGSRSG